MPEHRDMIFRETFGHFADLMTGALLWFSRMYVRSLTSHRSVRELPLPKTAGVCDGRAAERDLRICCAGLGQHLAEHAWNPCGAEDDRLPVHPQTGKSRFSPVTYIAYETRQTDLKYNAQIHAIIMALSLHVVVLIKDLNGNHVIQKCLNKLAPEDNQVGVVETALLMRNSLNFLMLQFIYNAVAANCVEVATHRHGCCVLQRCVDHASDQQRVQLVNEITYNALTLVQDPYGNYVSDPPVVGVMFRVCSWSVLAPRSCNISLT